MKRTKAQQQKLIKEAAGLIIGVGAAWASWKYFIKPRFFPDNTETKNDNQNENTSKELPEPTNENKTNKKEPFNIDSHIKYGDKGEAVYKIQTAINAIARLRGDNYFYSPDLKKDVSFPLPTDPKNSEFAERTRAAAKWAFPAYKTKGYITVRRAREQWARVAGYYDKDFPSQLAGVSNYDDLQKIYQISRAKKVIEDII